MASPPKVERVAAVAGGRLQHRSKNELMTRGQPLGALVAEPGQPLGERREAGEVGHDHGAVDLVGTTAAQAEGRPATARSREAGR